MKHTFWPEGAYRVQGGGGHNSWSTSDTGSITKGSVCYTPQGKSKGNPLNRPPGLRYRD